MQFNTLGNLFSVANGSGFFELIKGTYKGYESLDDMLNTHVQGINRNFKINSEGISEFTSAQIQAKASAMGLTDSLTTELIALGKDATFTQKAATGKLTFGKALRNNIGTIDEIGDALKKSGKLTKDELKSLTESFNKSPDAYKNQLYNIINSNAELADSFIDLGDVGQKTGKSLSAMATGFAATIKPFLPLIAGVAAGIIIFAQISAYVNEFSNSIEKAVESQTKYAQSAQELESLNSEYENITQRIQELQALSESGTITLAEQQELETLQLQNAELERKIRLKQAVANQDAQKSLSDATDALSVDNVLVKTSDRQLGTYTETTPIEATQLEIQELIYLKEKRQSILDQLNNPNLNDDARTVLESQFEKTEEDIDGFTKSIDNKIELLNELVPSFQDPITGLMRSDLSSRQQKMYKDLLSVLDDFSNIDLTPTERQLNKLNKFFDGSKGAGLIKKTLMDASNSTESLEKALHSMGLTLDDIGVDSIDTLKRYLDEAKSSAEGVAGAIQGFDGSLSSVEKAFESENADTKWSSMADYIAKAKELYDEGKVGTDDFQSVAQMISPSDIILDDSKFKADSYVEAWNAAYGKVQSWFNTEDQLGSAVNFANALEEVGLATSQYDNNGNKLFDWNIKTSAEAAKKLGVNLEVAEAAMRNLQVYGAEFDDVMFSGEMLDAYTSTFEGIENIFQNLDDSSLLKGRLDEVLSEGTLQNFSENLENLTEDQIIKIKFEYDLANLEQQIQQVKSQLGTGEDQRSTYAELLLLLKAERDQLASQEGMDAATSQQGYIDSLTAIDYLQKDLIANGAGYSETQVTNIQKQEEALYSLESAYLDLFNRGDIVNWQDFLKTNEASNVIQGLADAMGVSFDDAASQLKKTLADALGVDVDDIEFDIKANDKASDVINEVSKSEITEKIVDIVGEDNATPIIQLWEELSVQPKFAALSAEDQATEVIYLWNSLTPEEKEAYLRGELTVTDKATPTIGNVEEEMSNLPPLLSTDVFAEDKATSVVRSVKSELDGIDGYNSHTYIFTHRITLNEERDAEVSGTAHASGTAHVSGTAYGLGTLNDTSWMKTNWKTKKATYALTGEKGQELVVDPDTNTWFTVGDDGAEFAYIPKNSIVFNDKQTKELLSKGYTKSRGRSLLHGTAYLNGWRVPGTSSSSSGSSSSSSYSSSSSSNSNSNSNSTSVSNEEAKDTADTLDWIETLLKRIQDAIESLGKKASSVFKTWKNRNSALVEQMKKVNEEIALQEQAYNRYLAETEPIGLSDHYKELVRNGAIDIELVSDETLKENIQNFQTWYEKALECEKALEDLKETAAELNKTKFDNVVSEFEQLLNKFNYQKNMMDEYMNQMAAHGYQTSTRYYQAKLIAESNSIKELEKQRNAMLVELESAMLSGTIEKGSEAWHDMTNQIDEVTVAIEESHTAMLEYKKEIRDIEWGYFDLLQERITQITNEAEFLIDLMGNKKLYDDKGQLTDEGMATMGLYGQNYNVYMEQSKRYAEEIKRIDKELADDPYNQDLINRRNELLEQQREMILSAEQQKDAIVNLVKEGIELELESLKKLIDETNEALSSQKDLFDYQNRVRSQTKSLLELQKALSAYQGDDSEEAKVIKQQLQVNIEKAQQELQETEYDKYINDQQKLLDSLYSEYELILNSRMDEIDALVADMITEINTNASSINSTLEEQASAVGITLSSEMQDIWGGTDGIKTVLTFYGDDIANSIVDAGTTINSTLGTINTNLSNMIEQLNKIAGTNIKAAATSEAEVSKEANAQKPQPKPEPTPEPEPESKADFFIYRKSEYPKDQLNKDTSIVDRLAYHDYDWSFDARKLYYNKMGFSGEYVSSAEQNIGMLNWMKLNGYKKGLKHANKDEWAWTQEDGKPEVIIRPSDGSILTPVKYDDAILNSIATENIFEFANNPGKFIDNLGKSWGNSTPNILNSVANNNNSLQNVVNGDIKIVLPNVKSYEDFKHDMQHDPNFEKMIQAMTVGRLLGGSRLDKYKYK